jgi:membrane-bound serine protease (ClpP class)
MTEFLLDPNIAYLMLVAGVFLGLLAMVSPGSGALEIGAIFCVALAGYAVYNLSFNVWAIVVLALSIVPFIFAFRRKTPVRETLLGMSVLAVVIGSVFIFRDPAGGPAVNPILAIITSFLTGSFTWLALNKSMQAMQTTPRHDLGTLVGQVGEAKTKVGYEGSVQVAGELWSARSQKPIPAGSAIRVVGRDGFILIVEKI